MFDNIGFKRKNMRINNKIQRQFTKSDKRRATGLQMLNNQSPQNLSNNLYDLDTTGAQRPYTHVRTCLPQKSKKYIFYFIYLLIDFLAKSDFYTCRSFLLYFCYFTKRKLCEYCTIHFDMSSKPCHHNHSCKIKKQK